VDARDEDRNQRDIELFAPFRNDLKKKICIGAVSHRTLQADRPKRSPGDSKALKHIPVEQLIVSSDCGFGRQGCNREIAFYKASGHCPGLQHRPGRAGAADDGRPATHAELQIDVVERESVGTVPRS
jgi:5-methyltetrahydropteroyltriglutamate--homocysteine methyltransferase